MCASCSSPESVMKLALKNNLSETAFIEKARYHLRWFAPGTEIESCGHATLNYTVHFKMEIELQSVKKSLYLLSLKSIATL